MSRQYRMGTVADKVKERRLKVPLPKAALLCAASLLSAGLTGPALAQASESPEAATVSDEIIVTARKRQESILKVPVVVTAVQGERLEELGATEMTDLPKLVPGLTLSRGVLSAGLFVTIRGVGTSQQDPSIDQSISLNVDGLSLTQGLAFDSGMFDLGQIEVLKGPQALFYGKASPGGVISLRTADPTDALEVIARAGYEFEANERRGELIVSGPLSETLKARVAGNYSAARGYFKNVAVPAPGTGGLPPKYRHQSRARNYHVRGTLLWNPADRFSARLKANLVRDHHVNPEGPQLASCPEGRDQLVPPANIPFVVGDDCKLNRRVNNVYPDPAFFPGIVNDGVPFVRTKQKYGTLELNYDLTPRLAITSTTAYYRMRSKSLYPVDAFGAGPVLIASNRFGRKDFTQELRLNSDFAGPLNFTAGGFYQDSWLLDGVVQQGSAAYGLGFIVGEGETVVRTKAYSLFGQLRWKITSELELAGGARWTDETRSQEPFDVLNGVPIVPALDRISSRNVSPELTLTYTPTDDLTVFAAFKQAYKSGSFSVGTPPLPGADNSFDDEKVRGGEVGVKSRLFGRQLQANIAAYYYKYTGLQVGAIEPVEPGELPVIRIVNAGAARTYGIDFDATYRPDDIEGLELRASVNWNNGRYTELEGIPCWAGQTIALGCDEILNEQTGLFTSQNLSGTPMIRAPKWQATFGFSYEMPVASDYKLVFSNSNQYSSKYVRFLAINRPDNDNFQDAFIKSDVSLALRGPEDRWEVALIGKNITDEITAGVCSAGNFAGGLFIGEQINGGVTNGAAGLGSTNCNPERGRSVWLRLTVRPFN